MSIEGGPITRSSCPARVQAEAFAATALIFFVPANAFPFLSSTQLGLRSQTTLFGGIEELAKDGDYVLAGLVFTASVVIPLSKVLLVFLLARTREPSLLRARAEEALFLIGPWSMLDVFVLAVVISIFRFGPAFAVTAEIGSLCFSGVVVFTLLASERLRQAGRKEARR